MPQPIPEAYLDLFEKNAYCYLATVMPDGTPQVTPVWVDYDGEHILVNTAKGRLKEKNMAVRPQVGMVIQDPDDPSRYLSIQGRVITIIEETEGARDHINRMSDKYDGEPVFNGPAGQLRRLFKISPEKVLAAG